MKNNGTSFTYGAFIIVCALILAMLIIVVTEPAGAQSINQREWLLKYEGVSGYPAPALEPTATYTSGYPAPALEPTAKPKKQEPQPTYFPTFDDWDAYCEINGDIDWCVDPSTRPQPIPAPITTYFPTFDDWDAWCETHSDEDWCVDPSTRPFSDASMPNAHTPTPGEAPRPTPTYAPTMNPYDGSGYPAPTEETPGNGYPAPGNGYPAPVEKGEAP
jgi:hypothetical protein